MVANLLNGFLNRTIMRFTQFVACRIYRGSGSIDSMLFFFAGIIRSGVL
jgi:hypothetical protein